MLDLSAILVRNKAGAGGTLARQPAGRQAGFRAEPEGPFAVAKVQAMDGEIDMIRKLRSGKYRLYSRKKDETTGKRRNLGTFESRQAAEKHERDIQYFKRH